MSRCKSCLAEITWVRTRHGKRIPIDTEPVEGGNITLIGGVAHIHQQDALFGDDPSYQSHFATCPNSQDWRKR